MTTNYFITATDTSAGKTYIATKLIKHFIAQNCCVAGFKPIASGCDITSVGLRNDDALQLQSAANINLSYEVINPAPLLSIVSIRCQKIPLRQLCFLLQPCPDYCRHAYILIFLSLSTLQK